MAKQVGKVVKLSLNGVVGFWTTTFGGGVDYTGAVAPDATNPDGARWIESVTVNDIIQFDPITFTDFNYIPVGAVIKAVQIKIRSKYTTGGIAAQLKATYNGTEIGNPLSNIAVATDTQQFLTNPSTGLAWTYAELLASKFGVKQTVIAGGGRASFVYQVFILIFWEPPIPYITPNPASASGGQNIVVSNLAAIENGAIFTVDGNIVAYTVLGTTSLSFTSPAHAAGFVDIAYLFGLGNTLNYGYLATTSLTGVNGLEYAAAPAVVFSDPAYDYDILGGLNLGDLGIVTGAMVLITDGSGIYGITPGQFHDILYTRNSTTGETLAVTIPNPFWETTYFGD